MKYLAHMLLAVGLISTPVLAEPNFQILGVSNTFIVEVDLNSVKTARKPDGLEVETVIRRRLKTPITVKGKKKQGSYYVETTLTRCGPDTLTITESTLHSADGQVLASGKVNTLYQNPNKSGNFISDFIEITCNTGVKNEPKSRFSV